MPLFDFVCSECGREQEILIRGSEKPSCEKCGSASLTKRLSLPIAHVPGGESGPRPGGAGKGSCGPGCGCH